MCKPFIKWVGGKGQLIEQLEALLPADFNNWENATYIEPFVGGGAMFSPASFLNPSNSMGLKLGLYRLSQMPRNSIVLRLRIQLPAHPIKSVAISTQIYQRYMIDFP